MRELCFKLSYDWDYAYDWTKTTDSEGKPRNNLEYCNRYIKVKIDYHPKKSEKQMVIDNPED